MSLEEEITLLKRILNHELKYGKEFFSYFFENGCLPKILKAGGTEEEAEDCFYEILEELILAKDQISKIKTTLKGYFINASFFLFLNKKKRIKEFATEEINKYRKDEGFPTYFEENGNIISADNDLLILSDCLKKLNEKCEKVIDYFFFENMKDKEIAPLLNYSVKYVRNRRRRCILQLRTCLNQRKGNG